MYPCIDRHPKAARILRGPPKRKPPISSAHAEAVADSLVVEFGQPTLSQVWPRNKS